jgi:aspartyl-tRNA(Asn)/glutamyl-tRNA(Gln) amidotransferase subunit C
MNAMNPQLVGHIAQLSNIPVTPEEEQKLSDGFATTLKVVDTLMDVDTTNVEPTHQVTGLENVLREDVVDKERMFIQVEALMNGLKTHNGYFVVPQLISE